MAGTNIHTHTNTQTPHNTIAHITEEKKNIALKTPATLFLCSKLLDFHSDISAKDTCALPYPNTNVCIIIFIYYIDYRYIDSLFPL